MRPTWMIYGANGYTGRLLSAQAVQVGLRPVLAGRSARHVVELAARLGLAHRVFDLDSPTALRRHLRDCALVLHCAGPFSATARPMLDACLDVGVHYLDITGEIDVFEYAQARHAQARTAGIVVCPGVGFDVIPTDCVAATLHAALPDATELAVGFDMRGPLSPGTAKTTLEGLSRGGRVRRDGKLVSVPLAYRTREIDFGAGPRLAMSIPWGDVATAFYTTGIGNITAYVPASPQLIRRLQRLNAFRSLLRLGPLQRFIKRRIDRRVAGPDDTVRAAATGLVWGEVRNAGGDIRSARVQTANGYDVTVHGALGVVDRLLGETPAPGTVTPARLMGPDYISRLPGCGRVRVT